MDRSLKEIVGVFRLKPWARTDRTFERRALARLTALGLLMAIGSMTMYVYYATVYAAIQDVIEPRLRGTAVAIYFCGMYLLGASLGPVGMGMLSDHFAHRAMNDAGATAMTEAFKAVGLHSALYAVPVIAVLASLVLFAASRTVEDDIRKQERGA